MMSFDNIVSFYGEGGFALFKSLKMESIPNDLYHQDLYHLMIPCELIVTCKKRVANLITKVL
jgi:hypothetical protein